MQHKNEKTDYLLKITGSIVKNSRKNLTKKSLNFFAFENDIDKGNLSRLEAGTNNPKLTTLWKIAEGLGLSLSEFVKLIEKEIPKDWELVDR